MVNQLFGLKALGKFGELYLSFLTAAGLPYRTDGAGISSLSWGWDFSLRYATVEMTPCF